MQKSDYVSPHTRRLLVWPFLSRVNLTDDGKKALLKLSKGDMRRALNVLQACHAAYDVTGETEIYNCTGNPHPSDIETIVNSMFSDEFTTAYQSKSLLYPFLPGIYWFHSDFYNENRTRPRTTRPPHRGLRICRVNRAQVARKDLSLGLLGNHRVRSILVQSANSDTSLLLGTGFLLAPVRRSSWQRCLEHLRTLLS